MSPKICSFAFLILIFYLCLSSSDSIIHEKRAVFCIHCKHFYIPPNQSQIKYGLCKKFLTNDVSDIAPSLQLQEEAEFGYNPEAKRPRSHSLDTSPFYYVHGIYMDTNITNQYKYQEAVLCRMLPYLCGKEGTFYESSLMSEF